MGKRSDCEILGPISSLSKVEEERVTNHSGKISICFPTNLGTGNLSVWFEVLLEGLVIDGVIEVLHVQIHALVTLHALHLKAFSS